LKAIVVLLLLVPLSSILASQYPQVLAQMNITGSEIASEFAYNGTSFDTYLKEKIIPMYERDYLLKNIINRSAESGMVDAVNKCISPLGQAFAPIQCDFGLSAIYEVCQALPEATFICESPSIGNHLANRNITEGQTDKMAWLFFGNMGVLSGDSFSTTLTN
jgi:hypothetical protein